VKAAIPAGLVYSAKGFGGYVSVAASNAHPPTPNAQHPTPASPQEKRLLQATKAYLAGRYQQVEVEAQKLARPVRAEEPVRQRQEALQAQLLLAYSAARRKDFSLAQERFAGLRDAASALPDHGARPQVLGEVIPTFEEEAAFQHAVCTGVLQGQEAAEGEYKRFVCRYPESILIHAAVKRIARYHQGDVPKDAEKVWKQAMQIQHRQELATQRAAALCGPECLAEWLRRRGQQAKVEALAQEMGTSAEGTTLLSLARAAKRHGLAGQGVELTQKGLAEQKLPLVALLGLGHFVLVERVSSQQVQVWDPDARGPGKSARRTYPLAEWNRQWSGMAVR
jgi:predicted double-glycine peptidase